MERRPIAHIWERQVAQGVLGISIQFTQRGPLVKQATTSTHRFRLWADSQELDDGAQRSAREEQQSLFEGTGSEFEALPMGPRSL